MTESTQMTLDLGIIAPEPVDATQATIRERFERFHARNPWIAAAFEELAADYLARGNTRLAINMLSEVLRWKYETKTYTEEAFKMPNDFRPHYARLLIERHPSWADAFETRPLRTP